MQNNDAIIQTLSKKMEAVFVNRMKINDNAQKDEIRAQINEFLLGLKDIHDAIKAKMEADLKKAMKKVVVKEPEDQDDSISQYNSQWDSDYEEY